MADGAIRIGRSAAGQGRVGGHEAERTARADGRAREAYRAVAAVPNEYQGRPGRRRPRSGRAIGRTATCRAISPRRIKRARTRWPRSTRRSWPFPRPPRTIRPRFPSCGCKRSRARTTRGEIFAWRSRWSTTTPTSTSSTRSAISSAGCIGRAATTIRRRCLGDFLARRYPDHPAAAASAKLALASYERLQQAASQPTGQPQDSEFEARKMAEIAEFMTRRWPGTPAAETAYRVLISYAIRSGRIDEAKTLLDQVSPAARPALEAQLGNAMWGRYLERRRSRTTSRSRRSERWKSSAATRSIHAERFRRGPQVGPGHGSFRDGRPVFGASAAERRQVRRGDPAAGRAESRAADAGARGARSGHAAGVCRRGLQGGAAGVRVRHAAADSKGDRRDEGARSGRGRTAATFGPTN